MRADQHLILAYSLFVWTSPRGMDYNTNICAGVE